MPAGGGDGSGIEERTGIGHGGTDAGIGGEDGRDQAGDVAHAGGGQLAGVGTQFAGFIAVDKLEGEGDVAAVLGEAGSFGAIADGEFGVGAAFGNGGKGTDGADQGAGDGVEGGEVFLRADVFPPIVAGAAKLFPCVGDDFVEGVLDQAGEIGGGGQLDALGEVAAVQVGIAGEREVELADAGELGGFDGGAGRVSRDAEEVFHGGLNAVGFVGHLVHAGGGCDSIGGGEGGEEFAVLGDGGLELVEGEIRAGELAFDVVDGGAGQAGGLKDLVHGEGGELAAEGGKAVELLLEG